MHALPAGNRSFRNEFGMVARQRNRPAGPKLVEATAAD
jgi:hypothetical protein